MSVPISELKYCKRKMISNVKLVEALELFGISGNIIVLDHFKDSTKTALSTIPFLLNRMQPDQIYTANIGVKNNNAFTSTPDSSEIVAMAKALGVHADETDILTYMQRFGRLFTSCYLDLCCSFETMKTIILFFVANHIDVTQCVLVAFTVEMHRTMHRDGKFSNNELIRDFIFGDFKQALPFTFCDPMVWMNMSDSSNKMQFVIIKLTPAEFPHQSHMAFNPRDRSPYQLLYRPTDDPNVFEKGIVTKIGKSRQVVDWSTEKALQTTIDWGNVLVKLPNGAKVLDEVLLTNHPLINSKITKSFHKVSYSGEVQKAYKLDGVVTFCVKYEDGDEEEMTTKEICRYTKKMTKCYKVKRDVKWLMSNVLTKGRLRSSR